uniref:Uncharacterized protein n=1 Tax=Panagrolaimus davidi TaxID=227884 RepID=A0A914PN82_9BILA
MERYLRESVNNACGIIIYPTQSSFISEGTNLPMFRIAYNSLNSCPNETTTIDFSKTRFCSSEAVKPENIQIQKCCQNGHFCNLNLTAFKRNDVKPYKCAYKPDISFHFDESTTCEWYYDLTLEKRVYLHENFTTKIIHKTLDGYVEIEGYGGKAVRYSCSYIYAKIINVDSKDCKQNYNEMGSIKPFYYCLCGEINCDAVKTLSPPKKGFECETVMRTDINYINIGQTAAKDKWICFVTTDFFPESSKIEAGHLDMNTAKEEMKECLKNDTIVNSKFCCIDIVKTNQSLTECTVEKQIERFKEDLKNPNVSQTLTNDFNSKYIHCMPNDILNTEAEICPKTGGCFSTRILRPSTITSTDYIEPAGCLGYAEKYATLNLPLTSLSLGCRTSENSNQCSVVYGPNGEQRIVCCCNENNENGKCETNLEKIPNNIGKPISSFKTV